MLRLVPSPTFTSKFRLTVPGAADGAVIDVTWRHKGRSAYRTWIESADGDQPRSDLEMLHDVIADWLGPIDDTGAPVPYSSEALQQLLDAYPAAAEEFFTEYRQALWESREKN